MRHLSGLTQIEKARFLIDHYSEHFESIPEDMRSLVRWKIAQWRSLLPT